MNNLNIRGGVNYIGFTLDNILVNHISNKILRILEIYIGYYSSYKTILKQDNYGYINSLFINK